MLRLRSGPKLPELFIGDTSIKHCVGVAKNIARPCPFLTVEPTEPVNFVVWAGEVSIERYDRVRD